MPESVEKLAERLDGLCADLADARDERDRIETEAAEARASGRAEDAESLLADLPAVRDRVENLEATIPLVRDQLDAAREAEQHDAAQRRGDELAALISARIDNATTDRRSVESELSDLVEAAEDYLSVQDDVRKLDAELDLLCRLYDLDRPDTATVDGSAYSDFLSDVLAPASRKLQQLLRRYPLGVRQSPRGLMLARRLDDLFRDEPGPGRVYSRARGVAGLLSDATREIAEPEIRARIREMYNQIRPERRDKYQPPGE